MIKLYTIGFTKKSAQTFFELLKNAKIEKLTDTRTSNTSQLAGFAKGNDLAYFAKEVGKMDYEHIDDFAPNLDSMRAYRDKKMTWEAYEEEYLNLLDMRKVKSKYEIETLHQSCLLCSEHEAEKCHRRLLAEYFAAARNDVEIVHLM